MIYYFYYGFLGDFFLFFPYCPGSIHHQTCLSFYLMLLIVEI